MKGGRIVTIEEEGKQEEGKEKRQGGERREEREKKVVQLYAKCNYWATLLQIIVRKKNKLLIN